MQKIDPNQLQFLRQSAQLEEHIPITARSLNLILSLLVFSLILWMILTPVEEFTQAVGEIVPTGFIQVIEHPDGGAIDNIFVKEGILVKPGAPLIHFDPIGLEQALRRARIVEQEFQSEKEHAQNLLNIQEKLLSKGYSSKVDYLKLKQNLHKVNNQWLEQKETIGELEKRLEKLTLKSPIEGLIKEIMVNTIGQVVKAGQPIMEIIPADKNLVAEVHISPSDIGYVTIGQPVRVKITAYDFYRFGYVDGTLIFVTPSTLTDGTGEKYYRGRIALSRTYVGKNNAHRILPGMQVQAAIITGRKSIFAFLMKPIQRAIENSFSEK